MLSGYAENPGPKFLSFGTFAESLKTKYGLDLSNTQHYARTDMGKVCREYNLATVAQLKSRMPDMGLMSSMCHMFDCHRYPESADNFNAVDAHVKTVLSHYNGMGHGLGDNLVDSGWSEWQRFRLDMHKHRQEQVTDHKTVRRTVGADGETRLSSQLSLR